MTYWRHSETVYIACETGPRQGNHGVDTILRSVVQPQRVQRHIAVQIQLGGGICRTCLNVGSRERGMRDDFEVDYRDIRIIIGMCKKSVVLGVYPAV
jgi:hypothetical protein